MEPSAFDEPAFFRPIHHRQARALLIGRQALDVPLSDTERHDVLALKKWFTSRYPTGADRLAYVRRAYVRWQQNSLAGHGET